MISNKKLFIVHKQLIYCGYIEGNAIYIPEVIIENFNHSQAFSMTDSVNVYNIKPHDGLPPIKIIDTPGFGDTRGIAQDK